MTGVLDAILAAKARRAPYAGPDRSGLPRRSLTAALAGSAQLVVIAEFKRRSPSGGAIAPDGDPERTARAYEQAGAAALSVLTEPEFFAGSAGDLDVARTVSRLPVLRKDFLVDEKDIWESRRMGADAILLIVRVVGDALADLLQAASAAGLEALVEVHDEAEAEAALTVGAKLVGVNNRDLDTLTTDLATTRRLLPLLRGRALIVSESGLSTAEQCRALAAEGVDAFLIGEALLRGTGDAILGAELRL